VINVRSFPPEGEHGLLELFEVDHAVPVSVVLSDQRLDQLLVAPEIQSTGAQDASELLPLDAAVTVEVETFENIADVLLTRGVRLVHTAGDKLVVVELSVLV
jgi:hypothetical protein